MHPAPHLPYYPLHDQGLPDDDYDNFSYYIIRGDNWQIDALPAAPVHTHVLVSDWIPGTMEYPVE